jgi:hypothetical protein
MSFDPSHFIVCNCWRCKNTYDNYQNKIWLHKGTGLYDKETFNALPLNMPLNFNETFRNIEFEKRKYTTRADKPFGCIWFSAGSWLYDCYCDGDHSKQTQSTDQKNDDDLQTKNTIKVISTTDPQNILHISSSEQLENFVQIYGERCFDFKTFERKEKIKNLKYQLDHLLECREPFFNYFKTQIEALGLNYEKIILFLQELCNNDPNIDFDYLAKLQLNYPNIEEILFEHHNNFSENDIFSIKIHRRSKSEYFLERSQIINIYRFILLDHLEKEPDTFIINRNRILWLNIYKDGYYGVSFSFRKVNHIYDNEQNLDLYNKFS